MVIGLGILLLFLFVPETFWDRTPLHKSRNPSRRPSVLRRLSSRATHLPKPWPSSGLLGTDPSRGATNATAPEQEAMTKDHDKLMRTEYHNINFPESIHHHQHHNHHKDRDLHVGFLPVSFSERQAGGEGTYVAGPTSGGDPPSQPSHEHHGIHSSAGQMASRSLTEPASRFVSDPVQKSEDSWETPEIDGHSPSPMAFPQTPLPNLPRCNSPSSEAHTEPEYFSHMQSLDNEKLGISTSKLPPKTQMYTHVLRDQPARSFIQQLKPFHGRLNHDRWLKVAIRPFILFSYPSVLWSAAVYACSVGWLIVVSESIAMIYRNASSYNFNALQTGLVYLSPFIGGILGTAVAGKVSDVIIKAMARRNGGLYEPEFRLVMAAPVLVTTVIGLMGFGWSAQERDHWMVPTFFFGVISFGCSLGSTTSITFCVDSYRQYAGEALVTLNFSKNIFHGLIFSLFVTHWLSEDGPKTVFVWIGVIQLVVLLSTVPMYIYGKRARMWTVRKNFMEKF
jgi:hypothetical protein